MQLNGFWEVFGVACLGGLLLELYKWYGLRTSARLPDYARSPLYWFLSLAMTVAGGVLATLYGTTDVTALLALNIGLSAPAVIRALSGGVQVDGVPETTRRGRAADATVRRFLAGV